MKNSRNGVSLANLTCAREVMGMSHDRVVPIWNDHCGRTSYQGVGYHFCLQIPQTYTNDNFEGVLEVVQSQLARLFPSRKSINSSHHSRIQLTVEAVKILRKTGAGEQ